MNSISSIDVIRALPALLAALDVAVREGAGKDELALICRTIEMVAERRIVHEDTETATYYVASDTPGAPYRVTPGTCTCPRARDVTCKHRLLVSALSGHIAPTGGFTYRRWTAKKEQLSFFEQQ